MMMIMVMVVAMMMVVMGMIRMMMEFDDDDDNNEVDYQKNNIHCNSTTFIPLIGLSKYRSMSQHKC